MTFIIEIATTDFETTKSAVKGGADRIELCANLDEGGTTPSYGTILQCREAFDVLLYPIVRPRGGDFLYTDDEFEIILHEVKLCKQMGCDGIVIGALDTSGRIDIKRTSALTEIAYPMGVTFHRAFDRCLDPFEAMEQLIEIGCERILTSGQQPSVNDGIELIIELNKLAAGRIIIMPGSGVRKDNIRSLAEKTGCTEFHSSLRSKTKSKMDFVHPSFMDSGESYLNNSIDTAEVYELKKILQAAQL
jgi:copper homeostasis protein